MVGKSGDAGRAKERDVLEVLDQIKAALAGLQFGEVTVTMQDGVVVQIERTERIRLQKLTSRR